MNRTVLALAALCVACSDTPSAPDIVDTQDAAGDTPHVDTSNDDIPDDDVPDDVEDTANWSDALKLVVDEVEVALGVGGVQTIARKVGDDLYVEVQWSIAEPNGGRLRLGFRLEGAGVGDVIAELDDSRVELYGVEHMLSRPVTWARLYTDDPRPTGRVRVQHDGTTTLWLALRASLTVLGAEPRDPLVIEVDDRIELEVETRATYAGSCTSSPAAFYIPLQVPHYEALFYGWGAVERDCQRAAGSGCRSTTAGACGDGDRWLCELCFDDACVRPRWQDECFPVENP